MSKPKSRRPAKTSKLVHECILYAQSMAASNAAYEADVDGDSRNAEVLGQPHYARARQALSTIAKNKALTSEQLLCKARAVELAVRGGSSDIDEHEFDALVSFIMDVKKFLKPICSGASKIVSVDDETNRELACQTDKALSVLRARK